MTYEITFVRVQPGLTLQETLDRLNADFDFDFVKLLVGGDRWRSGRIEP